MFAWIFRRMLQSFGSTGATPPVPGPVIINATWADYTVTAIWGD